MKKDKAEESRQENKGTMKKVYEVEIRDCDYNIAKEKELTKRNFSKEVLFLHLYYFQEDNNLDLQLKEVIKIMRTRMEGKTRMVLKVNW